MDGIGTEIRINAPPEKVWEILVDFPRFPDWNPFIRRISGKPQAGARLTVEIHPPGGRAMIFRPMVLIASPGKELRWLGRILMPGIFDGEHSFLLTPEGDRCRFEQSERFSGVLFRLVGSRILEPTKKGFEAMNEALKKRAEA